MSASQTWRVVLATGEVREVCVERIAHGRLAHWWHVVGTVPAGGGTMPATAQPRGAVLGAAWTHGWPVVEILAPGEPTRAELVAGRTTPPTDEEIAAHAQAHPPGLWVTRDDWGNVVVDCGLPSLADLRREQEMDGSEGTRWIPVDAAGRSCAWPMPSEGGAA